MNESDPAGGKHYEIGDVGAGARVIQGDHNTWIEGQLGALPGGEELTQRFQALIDRLEADAELDDDTRSLAVDKTDKVIEGLSEAARSPGKLRLALVDAKGFLAGTAAWAWDELKDIVSSDAAQKTLSTVADAGARAAIGALVGAL